MTHAEYTSENKKFDFYCEILTYSILCILIIVLYLSFSFTLIAKKNQKFCDFDERFKNIEIEFLKTNPRNLKENDMKNENCLDNDLEEELLPNHLKENRR